MIPFPRPKQHGKINAFPSLDHGCLSRGKHFMPNGYIHYAGKQWLSIDCLNEAVFRIDLGG
jgi:hypothetical protein